jgi:uroporphyrinogen-III synthase
LARVVSLIKYHWNQAQAMTQNQQAIFMIRPIVSSQATVDAIGKKLGWLPNVVYCPLIEIRNLNTLLPNEMVRPFVFTSSNGVNIASVQTSQRGKTICVGQKVADQARYRGYDVIDVFETVDVMIADGLPNEFTYLQGRQVAIDLVPFGAHAHILYEQIPVSFSKADLNKMKTGGIIPVYSENAAMRLMDELKGAKTNAVAICISEKVAKRLDSSAFQRILITDSPTSNAMVCCIKEEILFSVGMK